MSKSKILNSAGIFAAIGLAGLPAFLTLAPVVSTQGVFADDPATANANAGGVTTLSINSAMAITAEDINISTTPTVGNNFITTRATVNVKNTGSSGGYHLIMSSQNGGSLVSGNNSVDTFSGYSKTGGEMRNASTSSWGWTMQTVAGTNSSPAENNGGDIVNTYYSIPTSTTNWNTTGNQGTNTYAYLKNTTDYTNTTSGDNVTIGYGFAIGPDIPAGTYTDTIVYTAIPNKDNRTIFDMANMQDLAIYLDACYNTPTPAVRTGDTPDTAVTESMNSLTGYSVGQINTDKIPTVTLKDNRPMTGSTRDDLNADRTKSYTIKKLADGHCWMTESLTIENRTLTSADSNVTDDFELPEAVASVATKDAYDVAYVSNDGNNGAYLYNFYAATAGFGDGSVADAQDSPRDICPKGWQLPSGSGDMSWDKLLRVGHGVYEISTGGNEYSASKVNWGQFDDGTVAHIGVKTATGNPLNLQTTGYFANKQLLSASELGNFWTRYNMSETYALNAYMSESSAYIQHGSVKFFGRAVRCVAK